ncbi:MAG: DUF3592 domain-containing protein [Cohaesibacter sp.]|nr:DUF3592 domain-containing protein [Cohaesibacter sp.]MCV6602023.1 DUF3592 domain-containing protein [Cohaesibacter sp.]
MPTPMPQEPAAAQCDMSKMNRFWHVMALYGVPCALLLAGLAFLSLGILLVQDAKDARNWPNVDAKILSSSIATVKQTKGRKKTFHYPNVLYQYEKDGKLIEDDRLSMSDMGYAKIADAKAILEDYPKGSIHPVYLDPDNPSVAILRPGEDSIATFALWFGVGFLVVGIFAWWGLPKVAAKVRFHAHQQRIEARRQIWGVDS